MYVVTQTYTSAKCIQIFRNMIYLDRVQKYTTLLSLLSVYSLKIIIIYMSIYVTVCGLLNTA